MAANDLLSAAEGRTAVNLGSNTNQDTELATFISGISERIDVLCGPVVIRTVSSEQHNGGRWRIWPRFSPIDSVSNVTEYRHTTATTLTEESNASKPASGFLLDHAGNRAFIIRRAGGVDALFPTGRKNVVVTYDAGRAADTAGVAAKFKLAAASILRRLWARESSAWAQQPSEYFDSVENPTPTLRFFRAVDPMIHELLPDELRAPPVGR